MTAAVSSGLVTGHYLESIEGANDLFEVIARSAEGVGLCASASCLYAQGIQKVFEQAKWGLSLPQVVVGLNHWRHAVCDAWNEEKVSLKAVGTVLARVAGVVNAIAQSLLFVESSCILSLSSRQLGAANGLINATFLILDGAELVRDVSMMPQSDQQMSKIGLNLIKNIASVAASMLLLMSGFGLLSGLSGCGLALSVWGLTSLSITAKLTGYLFDRWQSTDSCGGRVCAS